jgi:uncharacterized protein (DUF1501 family)
MMITIGQGKVKTCTGVSRRDFLRVGGVGLGSLGLSLADLNALATDHRWQDRAVILLMLVGGPSQLETWDPKPDAPREIRGPFGSIATRVPGVRISEHLPRLAARTDRLALVRSVHHQAAPIHETGHQLLQTGRLCRPGEEHPHIGAVASRLLENKSPLPPFVIIPGPIENTGVQVPHGQSAGWLGAAYEPFFLAADPASSGSDMQTALDRARRFLDRAVSRSGDPGEALAAAANRLLSRPATTAFQLAEEHAGLRDAYGRNTFGQSCLLARRLVEAGVRLVTVNMFDTVFNKTTWDCHGAAPFSTLDDYAEHLLPTLDQALSALLDDLGDRGLLDSTMVVATGEFGRTPRLNAAGGRDHWPGVWSALLAGGGVRGGQVVGASDHHAEAPAQRPVSPQELLATMYHSLGISPDQYLQSAGGESFALVDDARPIAELFT